MFYIKENLNDTTSISVEINNENVYCRCPQCGAERPEDEVYKDCYFVNANSTTPPQIVDQQVQPILDQNEVYSGCYARVAVTFYAFNSNGNKGIACGLGNIQKVRDGEPLSGHTNAADDFDALESDDFLD